MSDSEELDDLRERKRRELVERATGEGNLDGSGSSDGTGTSGSADGAASTPTEPVHVESPAHLDELTNAHQVVLVDFYADWCGPCTMLEPIVETIASDTAAVVAKVDVDRHQGLAGQAGVRGVPTLVLYAGGEAVEQLVGVQDEAKLRQLIARYS